MPLVATLISITIWLRAGCLPGLKAHCPGVTDSQAYNMGSSPYFMSLLIVGDAAAQSCVDTYLQQLAQQTNVPPPCAP